MATVKNTTHWNCGCGVSVKTLAAAKAHAEEYGHTLTAFGLIVPNK